MRTCALPAVASPQPAQTAQGHTVRAGITGSFTLAGGVYTIKSTGGNFAPAAADTGYFTGFTIPKNGNAILTARITKLTTG